MVARRPIRGKRVAGQGLAGLDCAAAAPLSTLRHVAGSGFFGPRRERAGDQGPASAPGPAVAAAADPRARVRRRRAPPRALAAAARDGRRVALARARRRIQRRRRRLPRAPLQRVRELPAVRAALPLRRRARRSAAAAIRPRARRCASFAAATSPRCASCRVPATTRSRLQVVHVDLYFFYGVDIVLLNVEVAGDDLPCRWRRSSCTASAAPTRPAGTRTARRCTAWPASSGWTPSGDVAGRAATCSSASAFLAHLAEHRAPRISEHWEYVLAPLVNHHSGAAGALRFRQIEYYRMPMMAYLAVDEPRAADAQRLHPPRPGHRRRRVVPRQRSAAAVCRHARRRLRAAVLLRPLLGRVRRRAEHALPVLGPGADRGGRCAKRVLPLRRPRRAGAVPPPALPALPDRPLPEGDAADDVRPAGRGAQRARHRQAREHQALQAPDPPQLRRASSASRTATGSTR